MCLTKDIQRCQEHIAKTFCEDYMAENPQDFIAIREAFQHQLKLLLHEKDMQALRSRAKAAVNNTIQTLQGKAA